MPACAGVPDQHILGGRFAYEHFHFEALAVTWPIAKTKIPNACRLPRAASENRILSWFCQLDECRRRSLRAYLIGKTGYWATVAAFGLSALSHFTTSDQPTSE
jgi:hypothetical protein